MILFLLAIIVRVRDGGTLKSVYYILYIIEIESLTRTTIKEFLKSTIVQTMVVKLLFVVIFLTDALKYIRLLYNTVQCVRLYHMAVNFILKFRKLIYF